MNSAPDGVLRALKAAISFLEAPICCVGVTRQPASDMSDAEPLVLFAHSAHALALWPGTTGTTGTTGAATTASNTNTTTTTTTNNNNNNTIAASSNNLFCHSRSSSSGSSSISTTGDVIASSPPTASSHLLPLALSPLQPQQLFADSRRHMAQAMFSTSSSVESSRRNSAQFSVGANSPTHSSVVVLPSTVSHPVALSANGTSPPAATTIGVLHAAAAAVSALVFAPLLRDLVHPDDYPALVRALDSAHSTLASDSLPLRLLLPSLAGVADCWSLATVRRLVPNADCWIVRFVDHAPRPSDPRDLSVHTATTTTTTTVTTSTATPSTAAAAAASSSSSSSASSSAAAAPQTVVIQPSTSPSPRSFNSLPRAVSTGVSVVNLRRRSMTPTAAAAGAGGGAAAIPTVSSSGIALGVGMVAFRSAPASRDASRSASPDLLAVSTPPLGRAFCGTDAVLVIDDDPVNARLTERSLRAAGCSRVSLARTTTAVAEVRRGDFALVLVDAEVSLQAALDVVDAVLEVTSSAPPDVVAIVEPASSLDVVRRCTEAGCANVLTAPTSVPQFEQLLSTTRVRLAAHSDGGSGANGSDGDNAQPLALLADDDATMRVIVSHSFKKIGWRVEAFASGEELLLQLGALKAANGAPRLVLVDYHMAPGMNGADVCHAVRQLYMSEPHAVPHLAVMTASAAVDTIRSVAVVEDVLLKPMDLSALSALCRPIVERAEPPSSDPLIAAFADSWTPAFDPSTSIAFLTLDNETLVSVVQDFCKTTDAALDRLRLAFRARDVAEVRNVTHAVRGAASSFSAAPITRALELTSTAAQTGSWTNERVITAVDNEWRRLREALLVSV